MPPFLYFVDITKVFHRIKLENIVLGNIPHYLVVKLVKELKLNTTQILPTKTKSIVVIGKEPIRYKWAIEHSRLTTNLFFEPEVAR